MERIIDVLVSIKDDENRKLIISTISNEEDLRIIGIENDEAGIIIKSERLKPDVLIIDLQPPGMDQTELAAIIHRKSPDTSIIMMCDKDENVYAGKAIRAGISGYLLRKDDMDKLLHVVKIVNLGGYYISSSVILRAFKEISLTGQLPRQLTENNNSYTHFTRTERSIIACLAQGFSDEEIARNLNYNSGSIKNYVTGIKKKTNLKNRIQIVIFSIYYGIINFEQLDYF